MERRGAETRFHAALTTHPNPSHPRDHCGCSVVPAFPRVCVMNLFSVYCHHGGYDSRLGLLVGSVDGREVLSPLSQPYEPELH